jgi:hypothetical protein
MRHPLCSYRQAAIVLLAPSQVIQVSIEHWLELPLSMIANTVGR